MAFAANFNDGCTGRTRLDSVMSAVTIHTHRSGGISAFKHFFVSATLGIFEFLCMAGAALFIYIQNHGALVGIGQIHYDRDIFGGCVAADVWMTCKAIYLLVSVVRVFAKIAMTSFAFKTGIGMDGFIQVTLGDS
jgi:hypothetical protein